MVRLEFPSIPKTEEAAQNFVAILDRQIDEAVEQLQNLHALRRSTCEVFGIDRRADPTRMSVITDAASRAQYEGDSGDGSADDRRVPRRASS